MNRLLAGTATAAICLFWACTSMADGAAPAPAPAPDNQPFNPDADTATMVKDLPSDLPGEIARAHALRVRGDYEDCAKALAQIMLIAPDDPRVVGEYGKVLIQQGRTQEAAGFLKRAAQLSPDDWTIYSAMGVALDQAGDHADAKLAYEHALTLKPGEPAVLNNLAVSRMLAGDVSGAKTILAKASAMTTAEPKIANNLTAVSAMQKPVAQAALPPVAVPAAKQPVTASAAATVDLKATAADQKTLGPNVVMEAVPVDPQAGPVPVATHEPRKLVQAHATDTKDRKPVVKPQAATQVAAVKPAPKIEAPAPALRTASDAN